MAALFLLTAQLCAAQTLQPVYDAYFSLKDALVRSDAEAAGNAAQTLNTAIAGVKMEQLSAGEHAAWMKASKSLAENAGKIATAKALDKQRPAFASLSASLYPVIKAAKAGTPVYYQYCPMYNKGAYWLSRDKAVKNPFYGAQMLTCGSTKEEIK